MTSTDPALDRRTLLKAGAWAAPAIAVAAAVPAASASNVEPVALSAGNLTLTAICANTNAFGKTKHGFSLHNSTTKTGVITLTFWAQAWGLTQNAATNAVKSVTTAPLGGATYGTAVEGKTYQGVWSTAAPALTASTGGGGWNAKITGTAVFTIGPNQTIEFWQENTNALGEPRVEAQVTGIGSTVVSGGPYAKFDLAWGGACKA